MRGFAARLGATVLTGDAGMDEKSPEFRNFRLSQDIWIKDLRRALEFVEPVEVNRQVYSHRLYELLLRACTEFESVAKAYMMGMKKQVKSDANIHDYRGGLIDLQLASAEVGFLPWRPRTLWVEPFSAFKSGNIPEWWSAYNRVKHSRSEEFGRATLGRVIEAGAGVFAALVAIATPTKFAQSETEDATGGYGYQSDGTYSYFQFPFSLRVPPRWPDLNGGNRGNAEKPEGS